MGVQTMKLNIRSSMFLIFATKESMNIVKQVVSSGKSRREVDLRTQSFAAIETYASCFRACPS